MRDTPEEWRADKSIRMRRSQEAEAKVGICNQVQGQIGSRAREEDGFMGVGVTGRKGLAKLCWMRLGKELCWPAFLDRQGRLEYNIPQKTEAESMPVSVWWVSRMVSRKTAAPSTFDQLSQALVPCPALSSSLAHAGALLRWAGGKAKPLLVSRPLRASPV